MRDDNAIKVVTYLDGPVRQDTLIEDALRPHRAVASAAMAGLSRRIPADCPQTTPFADKPDPELADRTLTGVRERFAKLLLQRHAAADGAHEC